MGIMDFMGFVNKLVVDSCIETLYVNGPAMKVFLLFREKN